jgi:hypothetical protein
MVSIRERITKRSIFLKDGPLYQNVRCFYRTFFNREVCFCDIPLFHAPIYLEKGFRKGGGGERQRSYLEDHSLKIWSNISFFFFNISCLDLQ